MFTKELGLVSWENNYGKWLRVHEGYMKLADSVKLPSPDPGASGGKEEGNYTSTQRLNTEINFSAVWVVGILKISK